MLAQKRKRDMVVLPARHPPPSFERGHRAVKSVPCVTRKPEPDEQPHHFVYRPLIRVCGVSPFMLVTLRFMTILSTSPIPAMFVTKFEPP